MVGKYTGLSDSYLSVLKVIFIFRQFDHSFHMFVFCINVCSLKTQISSIYHCANLISFYYISTWYNRGCLN